MRPAIDGAGRDARYVRIDSRLTRTSRMALLSADLSSGRVWLSSIVIAELYAGTRSTEDARLLDRIVGAMNRVDRVLTPTMGEWARAGRSNARYIRLHGELRPRDHLADILILVSAARLGGVVLTTNIRHFEAWADLARKTGLTVGG